MIEFFETEKELLLRTLQDEAMRIADKMDSAEGMDYEILEAEYDRLMNDIDILKTQIEEESNEYWG